MRVLTVTFLLLTIGSSGSTATEPATWPSSPFDEYGAISWENEKARLDNFAIQLTNYTKSVGAILAIDRAGGCPGEAKARAIRAKRYVVEHRGVPWHRVFWRHDGYSSDNYTTLLIVPEGAELPYPYRATHGPQVDGPLNRACRAKLEKIRRSRW